jgi:hypothetical protein
MLPFEQLSKEAREAHILPGLKKSLQSVNLKMGTQQSFMRETKESPSINQEHLPSPQVNHLY